jgi:arabinogalactan endo-1,4-beta-galactosidase
MPARLAVSVLGLLLLTLAGIAAPSRLAITQVESSRTDERAPLAFRGVDASFIPQLEAAGVIFRDAAGQPADPIRLFAAAGINLLRIRVWHTPPAGWCNTAQSLALARRAHAAGLRVMLCIHYSDTWADPGQQATPAAWQGQPLETLALSVRRYTRSLVAAFCAQGTPPAIVQIGNETTDGMLWPAGRISTAGFDAFATLFLAGATGVREATPPARRPIIMAHLDRGADNPTSRWFFDQLRARGIGFDAIGLSYYPWWHGPLAAVQHNLADLADRYRVPVMIVETAYPFTLGWNDLTGNFVGLPTQLVPGYPATPLGQAGFIAALNATLAQVPNGRGLGLCYWAPEFVANPALGSPWENLAGFDFARRELPVLRAIGQP